MLSKLFALLVTWSGNNPAVLETAHLASNIYYEARGESVAGQQCVAFVTIWRA